MGLETGSFIDDLVSTNPAGATDPKSQGDDHLRLIKAVLKGTFPAAGRAVYFESAPADKASNYTVVRADENAIIRINATAAARTVTLLLGSSAFAGFKVTIVKSDTSANTVTVDGSGAETINGDTTKVLRRPYETVTVVWDGAEWKVVSRGFDEIEEIEGAAVASAATADIWVGDGTTHHITGAVTITSFGTAPQAGAWRKVIFDAALTLTDGVNLNLPGSANITTAADDFAWVYAETTTLFKVLYFKADGTAVAGAVSQATQAALEAETNENTYAPPDLIKHSPGVAKFYVMFAGSGTVINASHNVTSITDNATGDKVVNIATDFSSATWVAVITAHSSTNAARNCHSKAITAGTLNFIITTAADVLTNATNYFVAGFGDQ